MKIIKGNRTLERKRRKKKEMKKNKIKFTNEYKAKYFFIGNKVLTDEDNMKFSKDNVKEIHQQK